MTEEEANKLVCPRLFQTAAISAAIIRSAGADRETIDKLMEEAYSIASDCAHWQWIYEGQPGIMDIAQPDKKTDCGYCGLSRK